MSSEDIRKAFLAKWHGALSKYGNLPSPGSVSGSSPPSVFVGSHGYPKVSVGPMVPPIHGDTRLLDSPEAWEGRSLEDIVNFRLSLVRGVRQLRATETEGRYVEGLQELAMSARPADSEMVFTGPASPEASLDGQSAPHGPVGQIKDALIAPSSPERRIERAFYDRDLGARDAVVSLYGSGVEVSRIQRCLSMGMLGIGRRLVPTRWSITATDEMISTALLQGVLENPLIDGCRVFCHSHLGNDFAIVLFPRRWVYEMVEAWHSGGVLGFGADHEDARGIGHPPAIAGAYHAARLGVLEYLAGRGLQSGAVILRKIRPEYAVPVGVWQVREGVRAAMRGGYAAAGSFDEALGAAAALLGIAKKEWLLHGDMARLLRQRTISDYAGPA